MEKATNPLMTISSDVRETAVEISEIVANVDAVHTKITCVRKLINELKQNVSTVKKLQGKILSSPTVNEDEKRELDQLNSTIKGNSRTLQSQLKGMQNFDMENSDTTALRIINTQYPAIVQTFSDVMSEYQHLQSEYRDKCKTSIRRQLEIMGSSLSEEEIDERLDEGKLSVFTDGILCETEEAKQKLNDVQSRHEDILKLEKSLEELLGLFSDIALLVEFQGFSVDSIEKNMECARSTVNKAPEELKKAKDLQTSARKKKMYATVLLIVVLLIIALIIHLIIRSQN